MTEAAQVITARYIWIVALILRETAYAIAWAGAIGTSIYLGSWIVHFLIFAFIWIFYALGALLGLMAAVIGLASFADSWLSESVPIIGSVLGMVVMLIALAPLIERFGFIGGLLMAFLIPLGAALAIWTASGLSWVASEVDMKALVFGISSAVLLGLTIYSSLNRPSDRASTRLRARAMRGQYVPSAAHAACAVLASREFRVGLTYFVLALVSFTVCLWRWVALDGNIFSSGRNIAPIDFALRLVANAVRLTREDPRLLINEDATWFALYVNSYYWYIVASGVALLKKALIDTLVATWRSARAALLYPNHTIGAMPT